MMSPVTTATAASASLRERVTALDWGRIADALESDGFTTTGPLLTATERSGLVTGYDDDGSYRSRIVMARHGFGQGEYRYFSYPLPALVEELRVSVYPRLALSANRWAEALRQEVRFPPTLDIMLERCRKAGQDRPTPLLLKYGSGDYNCLHQDLYGDNVFPFQLAVLLSEPEVDFAGGEFVLVEQRPRMQSKAQVVPLVGGEGVIFAVNSRPVRGVRGYYRTTMRHGVSPLRNGNRYTLGVIFHDAK